MTLYCGAFSHLKMLEVPQVEVAEPISGSDCYDAARRGKYKDHTGRNRDVELDSVTTFRINDLGALHEENGVVSCQGEDAKISGDIVHQVLKLSQYKVEVRREKYIEEEGALEAVYSKTKLPASCKASEQICVTDARTYIYNFKDECKYVRVKMINAHLEAGYLVDHTNKLVFKRGNIAPLPENCGTGSYFLTEYSQLYLSNASVEFKPVLEIDVGAFINSRSDYVTFQAERKIEEISTTLESDFCSKRLNDDGRRDGQIFRLPGGQFALTRGDVLSVFDCPLQVEEILSTDICYSKIPLVTGYFVNPANRLLTQTASPVSCKFPLIVKAEGDQWVQVGPGVKPRHPPTNETVLHHHTIRHEDLSAGGLYTEAEMKSWSAHINWGDYSEAIHERVATGVCSHTGECGRQQAVGYDRYDLNLLTPEVRKMDPLADLRDFVRLYGGVASLIVLGKWTFETATSLVLLILTYSAYGFSAARTLFQAFCCSSLTQHKKLSKKIEKSYIVGMRMNSLPNDYSDDTEESQSHTYAYLHHHREGGREKRAPLASTDNLHGTTRSDNSLLICHQTPPSA